MKARDKEAQFATAWMADERQVLCYLWHSDDEGYYVNHLCQDPNIRLTFATKFETAEAAWFYFECLRTSRKGDREIVENIFEQAFEAAGKEKENEIPNFNPDSTLEAEDAYLQELSK